MSLLRGHLRQFLSLAGFALSLGLRTDGHDLCRIEIVDRQGGWPVPLAEVQTTHRVRFVTDNAGLIAFDAPELMGKETWLDVSSHGYGLPKDGFGYRGVRWTPKPGASLRIELTREMIASRLGRLTGAGLFSESEKLGIIPEIPETGVLGCDSVQNAFHRGRMFWFWGDTTLSHYPLGVFHMTGATTSAQPLKAFESPIHLRFDLFRDSDARPRGIARMPGEGPTWVSGCVSLPDANENPRLVGLYRKIIPPMETFEVGLCVWNENTSVFEKALVIWDRSNGTTAPTTLPDGHPALWKDADGRNWLYFGNPLPTFRCAAVFEAWKDPRRWESVDSQATLASGADGSPIKPHSGSIAWNGFRKRWVTIFTQTFGKPSAFGEVWYAEADAPTGPWGGAVKILTHDNYTFYNPRLHPEFTPDDSPVLLFEGTYSMQFADRPVPTPRYDYNQILYRLDLDDPRLLPARK